MSERIDLAEQEYLARIRRAEDEAYARQPYNLEWNPTPEQYSAYLARERELAREHAAHERVMARACPSFAAVDYFGNEVCQPVEGVDYYHGVENGRCTTLGMVQLDSVDRRTTCAPGLISRRWGPWQPGTHLFSLRTIGGL